MNIEELQNYTMDSAAQHLEGQYYIGSSLGINRTGLAEAMVVYGVEIAPGDWVIHTDPVFYGYILGFVGELTELVGVVAGQCCFASAAEMEEWLATPMDGDAPELTCARMVSGEGYLHLAKNEAGQVTAFAFRQ